MSAEVVIEIDIDVHSSLKPIADLANIAIEIGFRVISTCLAARVSANVHKI